MNISDQKYQEIVDYISGELKGEEEKSIETWIHSSDENQKIYEKILKKSLFVRWSFKSKQIDTNKEWKKFENRINSRVRYITWIAAAASVILILSLSIPYLWNQYQENQEMIAANQEIQPGKKGARLILSTGRQVDIEDQNKKIKEKDGSLIQLDSETGLEYTESDTKTDKLIYNTLKTERGNEFNMQLADGTRVWLNADSELRYPVQFTGNIRKVFLKGEAYFDVAHDEKKAFVVNSYNQQVKVYGTEFCINAYNQDEIKTVLVEGSVGVRANPRGEESRLKPGELGLTNMKLGKIDIKKVNVRPYIAWKDGDFVFENESLENIMLRLERWYNVKIFYMNEECKNYRFSGDMERYVDVRSLLYFIQETSNAKFEINKNTIVVMAK
ncbi:FecR family protein [Marinifilum sp. D714]|uniref:FecR family protein n=1 Tax=Marinifilum sp. D714 TaxID=2937523 RepID=UPI0027CF0782|nr:FecR family protein [Marinifilum sp. D714]MDQ2178457.1 FecR domain-containing protein [Marinifilum sp. D714]